MNLFPHSIFAPEPLEEKASSCPTLPSAENLTIGDSIRPGDQGGHPLGLQKKLEAREPLEIDSFFDSTQDRIEKKRAKFEHFM
jgi:hypothetical protein